MTDLLRDSVYQIIREAIICCHLAPGQEIREQALAAQHNVSRSPVRDALMRLAQENFVTVLPRHGYRVNGLNQSALRDLFGLRLVTARACAPHAAQADDIALCDLGQFREGPRESSATSLLGYDRAFHCRVAALSQNSRLAKIEVNLIGECERLMMVTFSTHGLSVFPEEVSEHVAIIDAIQARDSEAARLATAYHITEARRRVLQSLNEIGIVAGRTRKTL